jgi:hypothetical protein
MSEGVLLEDVDVVELVVVPLEEDREVVELDRLVPLLELEIAEVVPEPSVKSLAPQTAGMFTAEPTVFFK